MARYFIITGEESGDRLGGLIGSELLNLGHQVAGWGGKRMEEAGIEITQSIAQLKVMGWSDVLFDIPKFLSLFKKCKKDILAFKPTKIILIDFGGFNLRIAKWAYGQGIKVIYYSPPKVWASRPGRVSKLKKYCDELIVLFPFEQQYYQSQGIEAAYLGHLFANEIMNYQTNPGFTKKHNLDKRPILAILPGSRPTEIKKTLPVYLNASAKFSEYQVCVSSASGQIQLVKSICESINTESKVVEGTFYDLLSHSDIALVTSGTATFEAALFKIPQIVGYKTSWINFLLAKWLIKVDFISLPNLICNKEIVPELIQNALNSENLQKNIIRICRPNAKSEFEKAYSSIIFDTFNEKCLFKTIATITS